MGDDLAVRNQVTVRLSAEQLQYIAHTEFVPKAMRGKLPAILACVAMGRELGLGDMVALNTIHVIEGRTSLSAEAMVGLVRKRGHSIQGNFSGDSCTVVGRRADNGDEMTVTWTKEMASDAGLIGKDNYKRYRPAMLWARGVSQLCRMLFADCFAGSTYTPEELGDEGVLGEEAAGAATGISLPEAHPEAEPAAPPPNAYALLERDEPMWKKLNVLVGTLRDAGHITNEQLWRAIDPDHEDTWPRDEDGELHWSPLRDSLTRQEAHDLIDRLSRLEERVTA
jgi:hypothetical protein